MSKKISWKGLKEVFINSFKDFGEYRITKMSGALAYYTVFSLGPLLMVIIFLSSLFLGRDAVEGRLYFELQDLLGKDTAAQLQQVMINSELSGKKTMAAIIGFVTLFIGATTVFAEIQDSINTIWGLKPKPKKGWLRLIRIRLLSFSVLISLGFLLLVSLLLTSVVDAFSDRLIEAYPDVTVVVFYIINQVITLLVVSTVFSVIFKVLPDANIRFRDVIAGAVFTSVLFMLGKLGISLYVNQAEVGSAYGAAGSLVVLLVWTYYSSLILFFGAAFTKEYALKFGAAIHPHKDAVTTKTVEVETGGAKVT